MRKFRRPHKRDGRFYSYEGESTHGFFWANTRMYFTTHFFCETVPAGGPACWIADACPLICSIDPVITWLGHASFLIQIGGVNILLDPIFDGFSFLYKRVLPVGIPLEKLPHIDFILISHNHIDHMDGPSLLAIRERNKDVQVLVPQGDKAWFDKREFKQTREFTWWEKHVVESNDERAQLTFTFLPAAHWSQRSFFDRNRSLWGGWMIEGCGNHIYFAGDSYLSSHFADIAQAFPKIDTALLPVGPCEPRGLLGHCHLDAKEAGLAFLELGAKRFVPMHWGAFLFGVEPFDAPVKAIQKWWQTNQAKLKGKELHCMKVGESVEFNDVG